jgi:hypothetical protein
MRMRKGPYVTSMALALAAGLDWEMTIRLLKMRSMRSITSDPLARFADGLEGNSLMRNISSSSPHMMVSASFEALDHAPKATFDQL